MGEEERTTNPGETVITVTGVPAPTPGREAACLIVIYGDDLGRRITLGESEIVIGRSSRCDIQLDQESVSRTHCRITFEKGRYVARDLDSTNGSYVNDEAIDERTLQDGDQLKVGRTIMKFIMGGNVEVQYHEEIYRLMTIDGLTRVHNRRYFEETLDREVSRSRRYGRTFALIMFDIDHFKNVNDKHGHLAGDGVLAKLGRLVRDQVRRDDLVARTGGEEFCVLTPECGLEGASELAHKLRRLVEKEHFEFDGARIEVTISLGVAQWQPGFQEGADLVRAADEKLYEAKREGRNRVCS